MSTAVELSTKHDTPRFLVDHFVEWSINTDGEVDVLIKFQVYDNGGLRSWDPLEQLVEDVLVLIEKYVHENGHHQLVTVHRQVVKSTKNMFRQKHL